ncbi:phosphoribosylaminoimidazole-succinocarboxamidesynthase [Aureobasidium pullulans]|uniref:Phosphoribosylaminoimidazole-succinocarboxamide synthase n=1 Tax=Aureobasidium pullulans TaxID=5580 RepID=A0A4S9W9N2_AURPU|nr:phosphoribosylaminoimidazole-succinocarboxamidesynthase [Aureobasidium pullulans]THY73533.1 phosphoribosylaminoimidazole-succinocarboxamidesynthase [Aureobasidium pullulans]THZ46438.1 phosphoribosylaminoimidazole-succinocarboxamidesynthase [Aureobasidium pullulans]THZ62062.1 phosphoribosylaminoimidazole-succinocarboxamidesynthase [Aureobasidium pullulans]THZ95439.1 phosphoribosylaminoimidazole-succinocarboxamidesynthase [Aureobasidium pullulans]
MSTPPTVTQIDSQVEQHGLKKIASGKVREIYEVDAKTLLFVATDRISAYDVIMKNGVPQKGALLTLMTAHWFNLFKEKIPDLKTHLLSATVPDSVASSLPKDVSAQLRLRTMHVRRLKVLPLESIVRGYITGSAWSEYKKTGTVHGIAMPKGLQESQKLEKPLWTPSTKAEVGDKDENISPEEATKIVGEKYAKKIEELSLKVYQIARDYAAERGIIIADTKFEFGLDVDTDEVILVDEVLTPDSSRFWPADKYELGKSQDSFDKQYLRDWLTKEGLKGKDGVEMTEAVVKETAKKYCEAFEMLTGQKWDDVVKSSA